MRVFSYNRNTFVFLFIEARTVILTSIRIVCVTLLCIHTIGVWKKFFFHNFICFVNTRYKLSNIMITIDEAHTFLTHQLKFANWKEVIERDKLEFLKLLVPYYAHNIYFQVRFVCVYIKSTVRSLIVHKIVSVCIVLEYYIIVDSASG